MKRIKEEFLDKVEQYVPLKSLKVLEVGCGTGTRTVQIAERCEHVTAIEPDARLIDLARIQNADIKNSTFEVGSAEQLTFPDNQFDIAIFTLSLHHVPIENMPIAISEAIRVVKPSGHIVFLEPTETGTFFETELQFDASDGDERAEKKAAYSAITQHPQLRPNREIDDETIFQFNSTDDFIQVMNPKKNLNKLDDFLKSHNYILNAERRINIFQPIK